MSDKEIIEMFFKENGLIDNHKFKEKWLAFHCDVVDYLMNRYSDSESILESVYRIKYNIEVRPTCPVCGGKVKFVPNNFKLNGSFYQKYCSGKCYHDSPDRKQSYVKSMSVVNSEKKTKKMNELMDKLNSEVIDDEYIKSRILCYNAKNGVYQLKTGAEKNLNTKIEYSKMKEYLDNRFPDANVNGKATYKEIVWRISHNIEVRPTCPVCRKPLRFSTNNTHNNPIPGYDLTCSDECRYILSVMNMESTMIEKYGHKTNLLLPENQEKSKLALTPEIFEKRKQHMMEKYGYSTNLNFPGVREKGLKISIEDRHRKSALYNELKKYMVSHPDVTINELREQEDFKEMIEVYDSYAAQSEKTYNTKKQNKTLYTSKIEKEYLEILESRYTVIHDKKHKGRYEHRCDFYIKELDLFIEYQGTIQHQLEPYIESDEICKEKLDALKLNEKFQKDVNNKDDSNYTATIFTWTVRDVEKRNEAARNNLNYLEIYPKFHKEDLISFIETYYPTGTTNRQIIVGALHNNTDLTKL